MNRPPRPPEHRTDAELGLPRLRHLGGTLWLDPEEIVAVRLDVNARRQRIVDVTLRNREHHTITLTNVEVNGPVVVARDPETERWLALYLGDLLEGVER